ncbi:predicted protein [Nematostella vectensis]|uniref:Uncharacterized protein n=1 Tax=Nematostella vectensis TaxID=45351 RepID=A7RR79_NEMVE|nr:predicted protein [Nematostella vectensis]|eukprot:XP_001638182.1 predicted protein [Nematostella vectensis]
MSTKNSGIYQLDKLPFTSVTSEFRFDFRRHFIDVVVEFHNKFTSLAGPLSLYEAEDNPEVGNVNPDVERPLTPVEEAIKTPPSTFSAFAKLIRPRLLPKDVVSGISISDQNELIGVLMNEINNVWGEMKGMAPDPFLVEFINGPMFTLRASEGYRGLFTFPRRLAIEIVIISQGLFVRFLDKAQKLNERAVFSTAANMSRLKTQLALEANKSLNILSIRRDLAMDMKHPCDGSTVSSAHFSSLRFMAGTPPPQRYKPLVVRHEDKRHRVHLSKEEKIQKRIDTELNDLQRKMPSVSVDPYYSMVPPEVFIKHMAKPEEVSTRMRERSDTERQGQNSFPKCDSAPYLPVGESLLDELGIDTTKHS